MANTTEDCGPDQDIRGMWYTPTTNGYPYPQAVYYDQCAKEKSTMKTEKFYRVKKDLPTWKVGAVLKNEGEKGGYKSVNDLYDCDCVEGKEYHETSYVVENSPEFFERVYPVSLLSKVVYKVKEEARILFEKEHTA